MRAKNPRNFSIITDFIDEYMDKYNRSPLNKEIAEGTGMNTAMVSRYVTYMKEHGMVHCDGIRTVVTKKRQGQTNKIMNVPVVGTIACGEPMLAEEHIERYIPVPIDSFGRGEYYFLKAKGDSMVDMGIFEGDMVLVRQQNTAAPGEVVVALIDDETTLKRFYPEPEHKRIRLHPENSAMDDIYVDDCIIQGVAVYSFKRVF